MSALRHAGFPNVDKIRTREDWNFVAENYTAELIAGYKAWLARNPGMIAPQVKAPKWLKPKPVKVEHEVVLAHEEI